MHAREYVWICGSGICANMREYVRRSCANMREYECVCMRINMREYAWLCANLHKFVCVCMRVNMREFGWICVNMCELCVNMWEYAWICAHMHAREYAWICGPAICANMREYLRISFANTLSAVIDWISRANGWASEWTSELWLTLFLYQRHGALDWHDFMVKGFQKGYAKVSLFAEPDYQDHCMHACEYAWILVSMCEYSWICMNMRGYMRICVNMCAYAPAWICVNSCS